MITIFCDVLPFSEKKLAFFSKKQCHDHMLPKTSSGFEQKTPMFLPSFCAKIFLKL
jgi:hypothetical protein